MTPEAVMTIRPLTPAHWPDLVRLFGPNGACAGCWCMWPRRLAAEFRRGKGAGNRRAFRRAVVAGPPPGVLGYVDGMPVGWCAVAPRDAYPRLDNSRVMARVDAQAVWSITCFYVARTARGRGLSVTLLRGAVALARRHGARIVEGYPNDLAVPSAPTFVWMGLMTTFRKAGFREVARRAPTRPIMRRSVAS
jgi:GNAT superfamily N-acetyltransferase